MQQSIKDDKTCFPPTVKSKISISECTIDNNLIKWRNRILVPNYEPQQTALIHRAHNSLNTGHPGSEGTLSILSEEFYLPRISDMVRRFVRKL